MIKEKADNNSKIQQYDILDLSKIVLALMVVAIHTELLPHILFPWVRLAVPLFFIISSYLLYTKINSSPKENKKNIIMHYELRLLRLYLFWFVVLLPITIYVRRTWFANGMLIGIFNIIIRPFLSSTFIASWYIVSIMIGTLIVEKLSLKLSYKKQILLFVFIYVISVLLSSYSFLFGNLYLMKQASSLYVDPQTSFLISLVYILFGKMYSEDKVNINKKKSAFLLVFLFVSLYIEWLIMYKIKGIYNNDYFMVMPTSILIFNYIKDIKITINNSKLLRQFSNFIYPLHASVATAINHVLIFFVANDILKGILCFLITMLICILLFAMTKRLEDRFKLLKYSY